MGKVILTILRSEWDRAAALGALALGVAAMVNGWVGVSGTAYSAEQMPYIVGGGLVGIFLLGVAAVLWLSADLRDEWRKLADLDDRLVRLEGRPAAVATPARPATAAANGLASHGEPSRPVGAAW
ncbi:MAG TPA: hypothetical protein VH134_03755 [Candidatus Dormibacteraeota bacterium]|jgi:hypothetical protein|nr:hypothetical protein [Candidatus Dormibacteraeota bacterium]